MFFIVIMVKCAAVSGYTPTGTERKLLKAGSARTKVSAFAFPSMAERIFTITGSGHLEELTRIGTLIMAV